ncbi:MAG: class B sortase [Lachnospiraceae bacterium]|nr:class B sortase [Lachnospiraceae bacterium]
MTERDHILREEKETLFKQAEKYRSDVKKRQKNFILDFMTLICGAVFLVCVIELSFYYVGSFRYKKSMNELSDAIGGGIAVDAQKKTVSSPENRDVLVFPDEEAHELIGYVSRFDDEVSVTWREKYAYLTEFNHDCIGYLEIPDTLLSGPVMFTPEWYDKYLWKNFSGQYEHRGLPFLDAATQIGKSQNYIIYGHNMNDGMNFGSLPGYLKKSYCEEHPYVYFNTAVSEGVYQVMYVSRSRVFKVNEEGFRFYQYGGVLSENQFNTYLREMARLSLYSTGVTAEWGDELISLVTCDHYVEDGRLVIVCKRVQ